MAIAKTLEDIITEQAPIVCEQIERAVDFADSAEDLSKSRISSVWGIVRLLGT